MNWTDRIDGEVERIRILVKEHGWGPLGSVLFHALVIVLLLGVNLPQSKDDIEIGPIIIDPSADEPEPSCEAKPPKPPENPSEPSVEYQPPSIIEAQKTAPDFEKTGNPLDGGVGKGTADLGIGTGSMVDPVAFERAYSKSIYVLKSVYASRIAGGPGDGAGGAIRRPSGSASAGEQAVVKALRWLKDHQNDDGSWTGGGSPTAMCGLALLCFMAHGEIPASKEFGTTVEKAIRYLLYVQESNGRFRNAGANYVYGHAIATYALAESYGMTQMLLLKEPMEKAVQVIIDGQQAGGAFNYGYAKEGRRDLSVTGWQIQALEAAKLARAENKGLQECLYRCVAGVKSFAAPGGGFGYEGAGESPTLAGAGILCLQILDKGEDPAVMSALKATQGMTPAWPKDGGGTYGWYYMTQARYLRGGQLWDSWSKVVLPMLVQNQQTDGHWESGSTHSACPVYDTTLCCLCLEVYYKWSSILTRPDEVRRPPRTQIESDAKLSVGIVL